MTNPLAAITCCDIKCRTHRDNGQKRILHTEDTFEIYLTISTTEIEQSQQKV